MLPMSKVEEAFSEETLERDSTDELEINICHHVIQRSPSKDRFIFRKESAGAFQAVINYPLTPSGINQFL